MGPFWITDCRPRIKESDSGGIAWRRSSKSKHPQRRSAAASSRPTLLLPPMRCTGTRSSWIDNSGTTAPVVTTRVQQSDGGVYLTSDSNSHVHHLPQPSAPSPGNIFYNIEDQSDITFIVGKEEWRFPAHSFVLDKTPSTLSALLKSALGGTALLEDVSSRLNNMEIHSPPPPPIVLKLPNLQPEVFEQIMNYIYTGEVQFRTVDSLLRLLHPSRVYYLPQLTAHCLSHISKNVNTTNVLLVLSHLLCPEVHHPAIGPTTHDATGECHDTDNERNELVFKCFLIVDQHADDVLQSELFETLELELMVEIVKRDTLDVSSETVVFDSVMRWACRACKKQRKELTSENKCSVLGKALYLVRYLTMTAEEFIRGPVSHGVLSKEDKEIFLSRLTNPNSPTVLPDRWNEWKITEKRQRCQRILPMTSPHSELATANVDIAVSPSNSIQPVNSSTKRKKKSMSKKLLNGVGDLVICVIQLLD